MAEIVRVGFVGAGKVNFGGGEGPWDHASRLERMEGVKIVGIADPFEGAGGRALDQRLAGPYRKVYEGCGLYNSVEELLREAKPTVVFVGTPPDVRGSLEPGKDIELQCVKAEVHAFVEKPVCLSDPADFRKYVAEVEKAQAQTGAMLSVGYMFRYHAALRKMKDIITAHGGHVMSLNASYLFAYQFSCNAYWWDVRRSGGPIVEQATHLADLARYLAGDVDLSSITCLAVRDEGPGSVGHLKTVPSHCDVGLPEDARAPRVTMAQWRFTSGGLGSLTHVIGLHMNKYEAHLEVMLDGVRLYLDDPYTSGCSLKVRMPDSEQEQVYRFPDEDPYSTEVIDFIQAVKTGDPKTIASTYSDAAETYCFTYEIRRAGDKK